MLNFEVEILAREIIKPSSTQIHGMKPFNLTFFDQLTSEIYTTNILFYSINNIFVDSFNGGIPFFSARAGCRLSEFLKHHELRSLNKLIPCPPFSREFKSDLAPFVCQATIFSCGGIAIGFAASHKLLSASKVFPPRNEVPKYYLSTKENLWFPESNNYITKRFTFDAESINDLRAIAKCDLGVQTLSGFIWKCFIAASWTILASSKPSIVVKAVDLRPRMNPPLLHNSIGNLFWWASCIADIADETSTELFELVRLMRESVEALDDEFLNSLHGEQGFEAIGDLINQLEAMFSFEKPDILVFTSWCNFRIYEIDLGWGKPEWVTTPFGEVGYDFRNLILFARRKCGKGIEAWLTLDEKRIFFVGERY
ncbi:Papain family cysteine protease [Hibiscus syriacus]|uniref:Papain family cysteine protease n=1 Tax=Hibiscus syriacus TaxID=106335 RepID=A0A6A3CV25_HIBSY|nr:Papain family cysteine protease [Hibiscus syriacus]